MTSWILLLPLLLLSLSEADARLRSQFSRYRSWNTRMYPAWRDGDPRFRNCWRGGNVTFDLKNDAPTLTGAKVSFSINLNFPSNQTVLSDGTVVWAQNCTVDGQQFQAGQSVYPEAQGAAVFPDGTPIRGQRRPQKYIYVWKTWGRFWQVADGPSSSLSISTENIPMGSYNMELVIYHQRGKDNFIPLGYASSMFAITDQVPFTISMSQVNDLNAQDQSFIQNRAVAFSVNLHDPSQYLGSADLSFTWDFGDNTGTLISRERTVTHTYQSVGAFRPQVILMASIPTCGVPTAVVPVDSSASPVVVVVSPAAVPDAEAPAVDTAVVPETDTTVDDANADATADANAVEAAVEEAAVVDTEAAEDVAMVETVETEDTVDTAVAEAEATEVADAEAAPATEEAEAAVEAEAEVVETEAEVEADNTVAATVAAEPVAEAEVPLVIAKRQAPELTADCTVYRYGSLATAVQVVQGIESVEIVQVSNVVSLSTELEQNAVDVTISCQGSLPSEVCTVVSDADCLTPVQTLCSAAAPSPDCQLVLRQFFNETGVFCLNVSLTNDVSLAVTSARVNVNTVSSGSPAGTAATVLGLMALACVLCCAGLMYRRLKQYQPLQEEGSAASARSSVPMLLWNLLTRQSPGERSPLLQGRIV
ncbi:unnamed protein product [Knipowitschia caucasica]|uniref:PKD domain-containing protein n=1 Tax=Knipowitschia caucasica TaxID=637954 RepID=A0AAV2M5B7_KNICA